MVSAKIFCDIGPLVECRSTLACRGGRSEWRPNAMRRPAGGRSFCDSDAPPLLGQQRVRRYAIERRSSRLPHGFTLIELLIVIAIIGLLISLSIPAIQASREAARRTQCFNNQHQFGSAFINHEAQKGIFPAGVSMRMGGPLGKNADIQAHSFFADLLPYFEENAIASQYHYDAFFCAPQNIPAIANAFNFAICPSAPDRDPAQSNHFVVSQWTSASFIQQFGASAVASLDAKYSTTYTGGISDYSVPLRAENQLAQSLGYQTPKKSFDELRSAFPLPETNKLIKDLLGILNSPGFVDVSERMRAAQITDGLSKTFFMTEAAGRPQHWRSGSRTELHEPLMSAWADPMIGLLIRDPESKTGTCLINCDNEANIYSFHADGAVFLFGDGHVTLLSDDTEARVLLAFMTPARGD